MKGKESMQLIVTIGIRIANMVYALFKLLTVQNKVVYISRQSDEAPVDFLFLKEYMEIHYPEFKNVILAKRLKGGLVSKFLYVVYMLKMMYHISTARAVILDTYCIPVSILKQREDLLVIQIWHALGAFKKFGYSIIGKEEGTKKEIADMMRMHKNYSYVFTSSEYCRPYFAEAFQQKEEKVKVMPLPRVDQLLDEKWQKQTAKKIYNAYPELKEKKVIVYTPTFRKGKNSLEEAVADLLNQVDNTEYEIVVKSHPLSELKISGKKGIIDHSFSTQEMLTVADYVITDYSATMFEALLLKKPLFFYMFDFEEYTENRDFYIDLSTMLPGVMSTSAKEIVEAIANDSFSITELESFSKKMISITDKSCTQSICDFVVGEINNRRRK